MKKINKSIQKKFPCVKLYFDDIKNIVEKLKNAGFQKITLEIALKYSDKYSELESENYEILSQDLSNQENIQELIKENGKLKKIKCDDDLTLNFENGNVSIDSRIKSKEFEIKGIIFDIEKILK